jgi:hypothetical protein
LSITDRDRRHIFALARELRLDDNDRKAIQRKVTGKDSTSTMTPLEGARVIDHLRALRGPARRYPKRAGRVPKTLDREPLLWKIEALLADMKLSWEYAEGIAWRITGGKGQQAGSKPGVQRMEWVTDPRDLRAVIAALHVEQKKRARCEFIQSELRRLGKDEAWLLEQIPAKWATKWRRHGACQAWIVDMLAGINPQEPQA